MYKNPFFPVNSTSLTPDNKLNKVRLTRGYEKYAPAGGGGVRITAWLRINDNLSAGDEP